MLQACRRPAGGIAQRAWHYERLWRTHALELCREHRLYHNPVPRLTHEHGVLAESYRARIAGYQPVRGGWRPDDQKPKTRHPDLIYPDV